jgi:excisionase family DNA binding protein
MLTLIALKQILGYSDLCCGNNSITVIKNYFMNTNFKSQQEIAAFICANAHDVNKMNELASYMQSLNSSSNDAGLASSVNENVQIVQSKESTMDDLFQKVELINPTPVVEPTKSILNPIPLDAKAKKAIKTRTLKPKEVRNLGRSYYTIAEIAQCFRIGASTMNKYLREGKIEGFKIGNQWRFSKEQVDAFESRLISGKTFN